YAGHRYPGLNRSRKGRVGPQSQSKHKAHGDSHQSTGEALNNAFGHELPEDIEPGCAYSPTHTDLPPPGSHADQHHVHDDDTANKNGDGADHDEHREKCGADTAPQGHITFLGSDEKV